MNMDSPDIKWTLNLLAIYPGILESVFTALPLLPTVRSLSMRRRADSARIPSSPFYAH